MSDPIRINRIENKPLKVKAMAPVIRDTTPDYEGPYTVEPSTTGNVVLQTSNKRMRQDVTVERATLEELNVTVTTNGETRIEAEEGYLGLSAVNLTTNVQPDLESKSVEYNTNGDFTVRPSEGKDGLSEVNVKVSVEALPVVPTDAVIFYAQDEFTIEVNDHTKNWNGSLYYSTDYSSWFEWNGVDVLTSVKTGLWHKIYLRGSSNTYLTGGDYGTNKQFVVSGGGIYCNGNLNNLLDTINPVLGNFAFANLFYLCRTICFDVSLPSLTITNSCYYNLFYGCSSLVKAPNLPATSIKNASYRQMFYQCASLKIAPELNATSVNEASYRSMFSGCTSLIQAPSSLPATLIYNYSYESMFNSCRSLSRPPIISATSIYSSGGLSCTGMFSGCSSLNVLPKLNIISLQNQTYQNMFVNCSLIKLSTEQTGEYQNEYRIPFTGTGTVKNNSLATMFTNTGGTFTGTPTINTTYYTSNEVSWRRRLRPCRQIHRIKRESLFAHRRNSLQISQVWRLRKLPRHNGQ